MPHSSPASAAAASRKYNLVRTGRASLWRRYYSGEDAKDAVEKACAAVGL